MKAIVTALTIALSACTFSGPEIGSHDEGPDAGLDPDSTSSPGDATQGADAHASTDAGVTADAAPLPVTLSETAPDVAGGAADLCAGSGTLDGGWYRIFPISDPYFALPSGAGFLVSSVSFSVWKSEGTESVSVTLSRYTHPYTMGGLGNLDATAFMNKSSVTTTISPISSGSQPTQLHTVTFSPAVLIPATTNLAVEIASSGGVQLGATPSHAEWSTGWFNGSCLGTGSIEASHGMIITVTGMPQ